ncbi:MAG: HAD-IIA family hydrolase [Myxococcales bacterium]|nr:HAD-IIA family hydrolase [Myxococcales bacterium]MCB9630082.1 HAD-IIA family hydrolase [Sandaracinaceae bacterium]
MELRSFSEVTAAYDVIFFDSYGVLKNSGGVLKGVPDLLLRLTQAKKDLYVITNDASKAPERMAQSFSHPVEGELIPASQIISSGLLAADFLAAQVAAKKPNGRAAYLGKPSSAYYVESAGLEAIPLAEWNDSEDPDAIVLLDDEGFDWFRDINHALNIIRRSLSPVVIGNADLLYPTKDGFALAVGSLANMLQPIAQKTFYRFGKPDAMMFVYALQAMRSARPGTKNHKVLMVGDTLHTDILGARMAGLDTVLVLSGNTLAAQAELQIQSTGIVPTYVCPDILS